MPEVPNIGPGLPSAVNRSQDAKSLSLNAGPASVLERPSVHDRVEISAVAHRLERMSDSSKVRYDLVDRIRQQIADGSYDSEQRLTDATERLLSELDS